MNALCLISGMMVLVLSIQLGRISSELASIERKLETIARELSKEYKIGM